MKPKQNLTYLYGLALAVSGLAALVNPAHGQTFAYTDGDLLLGIRQVDGTGYDLVVNLGQASTYDAVPIGTTLPLASLTSTQLGAAFSSLNSLNWAIFGTVRSDSNPTYPTTTLWASGPRTNVNVQSPVWVTRIHYSQANPASQFAAVGANAVIYGALQAAGANNTTNGILIPLSDPDAYTPLVQNKNDHNRSDFNGAFSQGSLATTTPANFATAGAVSRLDLYRLEPDPNNSNGVLVGYFDLSPSGSLTFTAGPSPVVLPPPTVTTIQRNGNVATIQFTAGTQGNYRLRFSDTLAAPVSSWATNGSIVTGSGSLALQATNAADTQFYSVEGYK